MAEEDNNTSASRFDGFRKKIKDNFKFSIFFYISVHIAMIVIAAMNLSKCPVDPEIPIYLLCSGLVGIVTKLLALLRNFIIQYVSLSPILSVVVTIELLALILGSYHTYKEYEPNYEPESEKLYCDKTMYTITFAYFTIMWALLLVVMVGICCYVTGLIVLHKIIVEDAERSTKNQENQQEKTNTSAPN